MSSFTEIRGAIKTKLDSLKTANNNISVVYDYYESQVSGYPAVMVESDSINPSLISSTNQNLRNYVFKISIRIEYESTGRDQASKLLDTVIDEIVQGFDDDCTLGGVVDLVQAVEGQKSIQDSPVGQEIVFTILLNCQSLVIVNTNC